MPHDLHEDRPSFQVLDAAQRQASQVVGQCRRPLAVRVQHRAHRVQRPVDVGELVVDLTARVLQRRWPPAQHLQHHHAEGVDLRPLRDLSGPYVQWVRIAGSSGLVRDDRAFFVRLRQERQPEVRHLRCAVLVHEDVLRLDISVEDLRSAAMEVAQAQGGVKQDRQTLPPSERACLTLESVVDIAARQELVDEEAHVIAAGEAHEDHQVRVAKAAQHLNLLSEARLLRMCKRFHRHLGAIPQHPSVHGAIRAPP
mmetsp:Transcript_72508/g.209899  ORF Transcript_72508/g.209899 Transcript_72508/m.209899 type:complete len:254 (+) Transcript_72508:598-1359(+)